MRADVPVVSWPERIDRWVWSADLRALPTWQRRCVWLVRVSYLLARDVMRGHLSLGATSLVYTTLLSLVPMLALSFSVLKAFELHHQFQPVLMEFLAPLGERGLQLGAQVMAFVNNLRLGVLGAVGVAFLAYTAISLLTKVESAFNALWGVDRPRTLARRFSNYLSVLLIGPILVVAALSISASVMSATLIQALLKSGAFGVVVAVGGKSISYALVIATFTIAYLLVPNTRVRLVSALAGGVIAGGLWEIAGWVFATLVVKSAAYAAIYSGFAIVILFLIWLYVSWVILLFGARIAYFVQYPDTVVAWEAGVGGRYLATERLVLTAMLHVAQAFLRGAAAPTRRDLAHLCGVDDERMAAVLDGMIERGWITRTDADPPRHVPAKAPEQIELAELWRGARAIAAGQSTRYAAAAEPQVDAMLAEIESTAVAGLRGRSVRDYVSGDQN